MATNRILALDVLRGLTIVLMILVNNPGSWSHVYAPLLHAKWDGCTPTDLVFPFFMFVVGVSMFISKEKWESGDAKWLKKSIFRGLKIILIGFLLNWFPFYDRSPFDVRIFGVLQRIGLAYIFAAIVIRYVSIKYLVAATGFILLSYWGILLINGEGSLTLEGNLVRSIDLALIGEKNIYKGYGIPFDPEGLLSTYPAIATILIGYMIGSWYTKEDSKLAYVKKIIPYGLVLCIVGYLWNLIGFPLNKPIWSSSYVLWTAGLATLIYCGLIWIIDIKKQTAWTNPFRIFGQNPLACFVLSGLIMKIFLRMKIDGNNIYALMYSDLFSHVGEKLGSLLQAISFCIFIWLIALFLDKKGWIIKV
jgi:predicted acyltransferase